MVDPYERNGCYPAWSDGQLCCIEASVKQITPTYSRYDAVVAPLPWSTRQGAFWKFPSFVRFRISGPLPL